MSRFPIHIAHITIELTTPLKVGSNASDFLQDAPVQKDWNNLPMILGTSLAGVLRKEFDKQEANTIFGDEDTKKKDAKASKLIISNALLLDEHNKVTESLLMKKSKFLQHFENLPIREHTVLSDKGVSENKFDEEVVYKGSRFKFSIEMIEDDVESFQKLLKVLHSAHLRVGGGSTKGFGTFRVVELRTQKFTHKDYHRYSSSLNYLLENKEPIESTSTKKYTKYTLKITPEDFFLFGSGFGDSDADATPVYEQVIDYENKCLSEKQILIPASSIKGALSHRTAFYYNQAQKVYLENLKDQEKQKHLGENNNAVNAIFGHKKELEKETKKELGNKGKILISDCYKENKEETKTFDHVSIDRFTGGAIDGALFQEKTIAQKDTWEIEILLENNISSEFVDAFEKALNDIKTGMLPLGGMTAKGHGVFQEEWIKENNNAKS